MLRTPNFRRRMVTSKIKEEILSTSEHHRKCYFMSEENSWADMSESIRNLNSLDWLHL